MDSSNNNLVSNRKLSPEERSQLMSSPELNLTNLPDLPDLTNSPKPSVRFNHETTVIEESENDEKKNQKSEMTGSTFFRSLASFLQTQNQPSQVETTQTATTQQAQPELVTNQSETQRNCQSQVIDNLLLNLEIISRIKENDKLSNQEKILEIDTRVGQFFRRWFTGDSRNRTLSRIEEIVQLTIDVTQQLLEAEYEDSNKTFDEKETLLRSFETNKSEYFQKFSKNMADAIQGLNNLKKTYEYDEAIKSRIDMVIDKLTRRLGKITEKLAIRTKLN
jgi:hypothetical protein